MGRPVTIPVPSYQPAATPGTPGTEQRMSLSVLGTPTTERSISPLPILPPTRPSSVTPLPGSPSGSGTAGDTSDAKARKKHPGRIAKLKGDLLCLAGKHQDGVIRLA